MQSGKQTMTISSFVMIELRIQVQKFDVNNRLVYATFTQICISVNNRPFVL